VFVQTNRPDGNTIVSYWRSPNGALHRVHEFGTGGLGGAEVDAPVDALASEGSLVYDGDHRLLFAVNAGSDSVTVFRVFGALLVRTQVLPSGGSFPASIAVHGDLVYVLNAGGEGILQGYELRHGWLRPLDGSQRSLGLANATPPLFSSAPAQVGFSPDGGTVLVATKAANTIDTFTVGADGMLSAAPLHNPSPSPMPFGFALDENGHLLVTEAGMDSSVSSFAIGAGGALTVLAPSVHNGQAATCWAIFARGRLFVSNTGANSLSAYDVAADGSLTHAGVMATTGAGPIDSAVTGNERFLYVQVAGAGTVEGYRIGRDGSLKLVETVSGLPAFDGTTGMEGIAAT
jgi:6-phosphogluconolactonase (cycloisomerase 2 family)